MLLSAQGSDIVFPSKKRKNVLCFHMVASRAFHAAHAFSRVGIKHQVQINRTDARALFAARARVSVDVKPQQAVSVKQPKKSAKRAKNPAKGPFYACRCDQQNTDTYCFENKKPAGKNACRGIENSLAHGRVMQRQRKPGLKHGYRTYFAKGGNGKHIAYQAYHAKKNRIFYMPAPPRQLNAHRPDLENDILQKSKRAYKPAAQSPQRNADQGKRAQDIQRQAVRHNKILQRTDRTCKQGRRARMAVQNRQADIFQRPLIQLERCKKSNISIKRQQRCSLTQRLKPAPDE